MKRFAVVAMLVLFASSLVSAQEFRPNLELTLSPQTIIGLMSNSRFEREISATSYAFRYESGLTLGAGLTAGGHYTLLGVYGTFPLTYSPEGLLTPSLETTLLFGVEAGEINYADELSAYVGVVLGTRVLFNDVITFVIGLKAGVAKGGMDSGVAFHLGYTIGQF